MAVGKGDDTTTYPPKTSPRRSREILHRSAKHGADEARRGQYLPVTTRDTASDAGGQDTPLPPTLLEQASAALFYAAASLLVIFVNKVGDMVDLFCGVVDRFLLSLTKVFRQ